MTSEPAASAQAITITTADLGDQTHQAAVLTLLDAYACDPMGDGKPLADAVRGNLISGLRQHPTTLILLAFAADEPAGIAVCFRGFSTFQARPLLNIHDFSVRPDYRGLGIARMLMAEVENAARELNCCRLTLEVLEHNTAARRLYESVGFAQATYRPEVGGALFFVKPL
jgi:ribosomal protein S18 acetylase RimI-like enzyme